MNRGQVFLGYSSASLTSSPRYSTAVAQSVSHFPPPFACLLIPGRRPEYNPASGLSYFGGPKLWHRSYIIATDGNCERNGTPMAQASCGIYYGRNSPYNDGFRVPAEMPQTNNFAELLAVKHALQSMQFRDLPVLRNVITEELIIKVDSEYVFLVFTEWLSVWKQNRLRTAGNMPVKNIELILAIDRLILSLAIDQSLIVRFWKVPREDNTAADNLARLALLHRM